MSEIKAFGPTAIVTPANALTVGRLVAAPVFGVLVALHGPGSWVLFVCWTALAFSDGLDGRIARWHGTTRSGAFLDPLADKFLVVAALAALIDLGVVAIWPVVLITAREVAVSLFRVVAARHGVSVPARPLAKLKTLVQDVAIGAAFIPVIGDHHRLVVQVMLDVAVALTLVSGAEYALDARRLLRGERNKPGASETGVSSEVALDASATAEHTAAKPTAEPAPHERVL
jgi:CDP-diacylglycerol--glycerol-3-phosphate 3-phosphatidyltransferase